MAREHVIDDRIFEHELEFRLGRLARFRSPHSRPARRSPPDRVRGTSPGSTKFSPVCSGSLGFPALAAAGSGPGPLRAPRGALWRNPVALPPAGREGPPAEVETRLPYVDISKQLAGCTASGWLTDRTRVFGVRDAVHNCLEPRGATRTASRNPGVPTKLRILPVAERSRVASSVILWGGLRGPAKLRILPVAERSRVASSVILWGGLRGPTKLRILPVAERSRVASTVILCAGLSASR